MTAPVVPPDPREPFTTLRELAVWAEEGGTPPTIPVDREPFAKMVLSAVAIVVRHYGSAFWTYETIPPRAKLIADLKAKNFYQHPTGAVSETTGPISERFLDEVVQQIELTDVEIRILAQLAADGEEAVRSVGGLWAMSTTRGKLETHRNGVRGIVHAPYWREYAQAMPYFVEGAFGSPDPDSPGVLGYIP